MTTPNTKEGSLNMANSPQLKDELETILVNLDQGYYLGAGGVEQALRDVLSWHQSLVDEAVRRKAIDIWADVQIETLLTNVSDEEKVERLRKISTNELAELIKSKDKEGK